METKTFIPNNDYIELLRYLSKMGRKMGSPTVSSNTTKVFRDSWEEARKIERALPADHIIRNTKLAFNSI